MCVCVCVCVCVRACVRACMRACEIWQVGKRNRCKEWRESSLALWGNIVGVF